MRGRGSPRSPPARRTSRSPSAATRPSLVALDRRAPAAASRSSPTASSCRPDATPEPAERPTFLTVARIQERYKGHDVLVRALALVRAKVPDVQWVVLGDGSLRGEIEALARSYGVADSIRFLGVRQRRAAERLASGARSCWRCRAGSPAGGFAGEGFGIVYLEAGAYGKPVVAGNVGGAIDAVLDGVTGLLVDPLDQLAVAEAITRLLLDPELARRLGCAGRMRAQEHAWPTIIGRVQAALFELLSSPSGASTVGAQKLPN